MKYNERVTIMNNGYWTYDKLTDQKIEWFDQYFKAESAIRSVYGMPEGYTFRDEVYDITDEDGKHIDKPGEECKPFCISIVRGELPEEIFDENAANFHPDEEEYNRIAYFDTKEDALAALENYKSIRCSHASMTGGDLITYEQYALEEIASEKVLEVAAWDPEPKDYRGESYQDYGIYTSGKVWIK